MPDIRLVNVTVDADIQPRANSLDQTHVADLMEAIGAGVRLPPVVVYRTTTGEILLSEGFHRFEAHRRRQSVFILAEVREGSRENAALNAMGSNKENHALKRTNADKRRAIVEVLKMVPAWSNRQVAEHVGVDHKTVADERGILERTGDFPSSAKTVGRDGKERPAKKLKELKEPKEPKAATDKPPAPPNPSPPQPADAAEDDGDTIIGDDPPPAAPTVIGEFDPLAATQVVPPPTGDPQLPGLDDYQTRVEACAKEAVGHRREWDAMLKLARDLVEGMDKLARGLSGNFLRNIADRDGDKVWTDAAVRRKQRQTRITTYPPLLHLIRMLRYARPQKVCDGCRGHGCTSCRGAGFLPFGPLPKPNESATLFTLTGDPWDDEE